ncbi:MAG: hypothetical protein QM758_05905 [Armatimonas sp.]
MDSETQERWKEAINPLDYLDWYALSEAGLRESAKRLAGWRVPDWAIQLRTAIISEGWHTSQSWVPDFALRSEVALIGLQILHPDKFDAGQIYRCVRLRFLHEALKPFVEYAEQLVSEHKDVLRTCYLPLLELHQVTEFTNTPPAGAAFQVIQDDTTERRKWLNRYADDLGLQEGRDAVDLATDLAQLGAKKSSAVFGICDSLNRQHHWRQGQNPEELCHTLETIDLINIHYRLIGTAFLTALESECPAPDWLQGQLP